MSDLERLLSEAVPDGTFGGARPPAAPVTPHWARTSPEQAAEHCAVLAEAISGWHWDEDPRHLHAVPDPGEQAA